MTINRDKLENYDVTEEEAFQVSNVNSKSVKESFREWNESLLRQQQALADLIQREKDEG